MTVRISELLKNLRENLEDLPKISRDTISVEFWTEDGVTISKSASGAKVALPLRKASLSMNKLADAIEDDEKTDRRPRKNRFATRL